MPLGPQQVPLSLSPWNDSSAWEQLGKRDLEADCLLDAVFPPHFYFIIGDELSKKCFRYQNIIFYSFQLELMS